MRSDRQFLEWHGNQWRVQIKVPAKAQPIIGKKRLVHPLHTDSLARANLLKHRIVADFKEQIAKALAQEQRNSRNGTDPLVEEAFGWRASLEAERKAPPTMVIEDGSIVDDLVVPPLLIERAEELEDKVGSDRAGYFYRIANGTATPISAFVDAWIAERADMKARQQLDYRRAVRKFADWLASLELDGSIEATTRKVAGRYVSEAMVARSVHWKTANKDISALSGYWKWLMKKGHVEQNVWSGQSLRKQKVRSEEDRSKRHYEDQELAVLLKGITEPLLIDAVTVAALSGMRLEEIARLKVQDCHDGLMRVREAKTTAGVRDVPIHSALRHIIERRSEGKSGNDYILHELKDPRPGSPSERGQKITKMFVASRRRLGIDDRPDGRRQSRIDFHSLRRWFIRNARIALHAGATGYDPWTIADVVGHDRESLPEGLAMTMGRYAGGALLAARIACVEAVKLPELNLVVT